MIISVVIGFVAAAVSAYILGIPQEEKENKENKKEEETTEKTSELRKVPLASVVAGKLVPLAEIKDQAFSTGALGKGLGIIPTSNSIVAPVSGEISAVFPTKHAIGIKTEEGIEVLIHIGIDTVELDGKHFDTIVKQGDEVKQGQLLSTVDFEGIQKDGYDPTVIVVITNTMDYLDVIAATNENLVADDECLTVIL